MTMDTGYVGSGVCVYKNSGRIIAGDEKQRLDAGVHSGEVYSPL